MASAPSTHVLCGIKYLVHPQVKGWLHLTNPASLIVKPATVITAPQTSLDSKFIREALIEIEAIRRFKDDVFQDAFLETIVIQVCREYGTKIPEKLPEGTQGRKLKICVIQKEEDLLPPGPYFFQGASLHQAWRLYEDRLDAFVITVIPETTEDVMQFKPLVTLSRDGYTKEIAVPSRMYTAPSETHPLAGKRISLKDCFQLAGIKTTMMNRAWTLLHPPEKESAAYVRRLIELGAVVVGKTKMCSFISGEEPPDEWIEYQCPFNPRADGVMTPSGSTTGGAAAAAGYEWLDASIGIDTTGNVIHPALLNGLFALRPTTGAFDMKGIHTAWSLFDTVGFLSRDITMLRLLMSSTADVSELPKQPTRILYTTDFVPYNDADQQKMWMNFVSKLECSLETTKTEINIAKVWAKDAVNHGIKKPLDEFLMKSTYWPMYFEFYHNKDKFRADYRTKYGREPYVSPYVRWRWERGAQVTRDEANRGLEEIFAFRKWFYRVIMEEKTRRHENTIILMPLEVPSPLFRDTPNPPPTAWSAWSPWHFASVLELPRVAIPIGQLPYQSPYSNRTEYRPVVATLIGQKGSDLALLRLAEKALRDAQWPTKVQAGRFTFPVKKSPAGATTEHPSAAGVGVDALVETPAQV